MKILKTIALHHVVVLIRYFVLNLQGILFLVISIMFKTTILNVLLQKDQNTTPFKST